MDVRQKFNDTILAYGHSVYVVHFNNAVRCKCFREKEKEGSPDCHLCFGTGFPGTVKRYLTRRMNLSGGTLTDATRVEPPGETTQSAYKYYFYNLVPIQDGDLILEPIENHRKNLTGLYDILLVSHVAPQTIDDLGVVYFVVSARSQPSQKNKAWKSLIWHLTSRSSNNTEEGVMP